jgi:PilZ domain
MDNEMIQSREMLSAPSATDQRRSIRYSCILDASCRPSDAIEFVSSEPAIVLNISRGGVGLLLGRRFPPDTILTLGLEATTQEFLPPVSVRVVRAQQRDNGDWVLGCEFLRPLGDDELQALLT